MKRYLWFSVLLLPMAISALFLSGRSEKDGIGNAELIRLSEFTSNTSGSHDFDGQNIALEATYRGAFEGAYVGSAKDSGEDEAIAIEFASNFEIPRLGLIDSLPIKTSTKKELEGFPRIGDLIRLRGVFHSNGNYPLGINLGGVGSAWIEVSEFYRWNRKNEEWQRVYSLF